MLYLVYLFLVYSFLGWVVEVIYHVSIEKEFVNRGFLIGPYCPIYGFGMILIIYILRPFLDNVFLLFILSVIITTILEFLAGYILQELFSEKWWDYSDMKFNIKGYVCLRFSLLWGVGALVSVKYIFSLVNIVYMMLPRALTLLIVLIFLAIILVDLVITSSKMFSIELKLKELEEADKRISKLSEKIGTAITEATLKEIYYKEKLIEKFEKDYKRVLKAYPNIKSKKYGRIIKYIKDKKKK